MSNAIAHQGPLWRWTGASGAGSWHFLTIDGAAGDAVRLESLMLPGSRGGFGSIKVQAQIGDTRFATSLFPHKDSGGWLLPVKASVRKAEGLVEGDVVAVDLRV